VLETQVPPSVRAMIDLQLQRFAPREQQVLEAAAIAGVECSAAAAAAAMAEQDIVAVERVCDELVRSHRFLAPAGVDEWPDGTVSSRYRFVHELYHNVVYQRLGVARRAQMHRALGLRLEAAWADRAIEESPTLATHFELGRDWPRAVRYLRHAGDAAARQYAHREAVEYFRRGLAALERLPNDDARREIELPMLMSLGVNMRVTQGCAAPGVEQVFARAEALLHASDSAGDVTKTFPLLWAVWVFHKVRSDLAQADDLARKLLAMAQQANDPAMLMQAHQAMCVTALCMGNPRLTVDHMRQADLIYDPTRHSINTSAYGQDPGVATLSFGAVALGILDQPEEAFQRSEQALALARRLNQPSTLCFALHFASMLHQLRGDAATCEKLAAENIAMASEESFSFWRAGGLVLHGWATANVEEIRAGLDAWNATGSRTYLAYYLGLQADALIRLRRQANALRSIDQALTLAASLPEGLFESSLHRLKAHCLSDDNAPAARQSLDAAIRIAQEQHAIAFERQAHEIG
jgi:tetratricopeptide (TPR) repeat protein